MVLNKLNSHEEKIVIGVIGGYGSVGKHVVTDLINSTKSQLIIGGRNKKYIDSIKNLYNERITMLQVNAFDSVSIDNFCSKCNIIINCAGPSSLILDNIAKSSLKYGCHYIDVGGYDILYDTLKKTDSQVRNKNLTFIVSAGWIPGISGIFPQYIIKNYFDNANWVEIYYGAIDQWSYSSSYDMVWGSLNGHPTLRENNEWINANIILNGKKVNYPHGIGTQHVVPWFKNELKDYVEKNNFDHFAMYGGNWDYKLNVLNIYNRLFKVTNSSEKWQKSAANMCNTSKKICQKKTPAGMLYIIAKGTYNKKNKQIGATFFTKENNTLTGIAASITAKAFITGHILDTGCHYMANVVDPSYMMKSLNERGFEYNITEKD